MIVYGITFPDTKEYKAVMENDLNRELFFFDYSGRLGPRETEAYTGPGTYGHAVVLCNLLFRQKGREVFEWHPDLETALEEYCRLGPTLETLVTGPASGGKTFGAALYAFLFWLCNPRDSGVLVCSTTMRGLKQRLWGDIRKLYLSVAPIIGGNIVDSQTCIQTSKGEMKRGIFGIAVAEGNETKALGRIIGFHPPRLLVIVDELTDVSWAIVEACTNLSTGKKKFHFIGIGNASSIFDAHGKMCEPQEGWNSVTVETDRWTTLRGGICLHFDAFKSPNVVAGRIIYKFLVTPEDIRKTVSEYGDNSPQMWRMRRGFWCPEGNVNTVLSEPLIKNHMCMLKAQWDSGYEVYAGLDPAGSGGDRIILRFGKAGKDASQKDVLELSDIVVIKPDATKFNIRPLEYQIADAVKKECTARNVPPQRFGMDITGAGAGLAAIISEEWGYGFHRTHFASRPSDLPAGQNDLRPCSEVYFDKVTELWYSMRNIVTSFQLKGLDAETAVEFCSRRYTSEGKTWVESKVDMKKRPGAKSPDLADAAVVLLDVVRNKGGIRDQQSRARSNADRDWQQLIKEYQSSEEDAYSDDPVLAL